MAKQWGHLQKQLKGVGPALITPFDGHGAIDWNAYDRMVSRQCEAGVTFLVPMGTTGESPTLPHEEHLVVIRRTVLLTRQFAEEKERIVPVVAGVGANSTNEAKRLILHSKQYGASAGLSVVPYYNKPTQAGLFEHFLEQADLGLPIILYEIPGRSVVSLAVETVVSLATHPNIIGIKDAHGSVAYTQAIIQATRKVDPDFLVLSGDDNLTFPMVMLGADGVISVACNIIPAEMVEFIELLLNTTKYHVVNTLKSSREAHYRLLKFFNAMFLETNPIPVKTAMSMMGFCQGKFRLPLCPMSDANRQKLEKVLQEFGLLQPTTQQV